MVPILLSAMLLELDAVNPTAVSHLVLIGKFEYDQKGFIEEVIDVVPCIDKSSVVLFVS